MRDDDDSLAALDRRAEPTEAGAAAQRREFNGMLNQLRTHGFQLDRIWVESSSVPFGHHYQLYGRRDGTVFGGKPACTQGRGPVVEFDPAKDLRPIDLVLLDMEPAMALSILQEGLDLPADEREDVGVYLDPRSCVDAMRRCVATNNVFDGRCYDVLYARNDHGIALLFVHRDLLAPYQARVENLRDDAPPVPEIGRAHV